MIDLSVVVHALQRDQRALAAEWVERCAVIPASTITPGRGRAVVAAVVYLFEEANASAAVTTSSLLDLDPDLSVSVGEMAILRLVLHRHLVLELPGDVAIASMERINHVVDQLLAELSHQQIRVLAEAAFVDPLTGAGNRRALERDAPRAFAQAERHGWTLTLVAIDLDGLKQTNDFGGHAAGDRALRLVAQALTMTMRAGDGLYRLGGDEFVLLLPETDHHQATNLLDRVLSDSPPFTFGMASVGDDGTTLEHVLAAADNRLMQRKRERRQPRPRNGGGGRPPTTGRPAVGLMMASAAPVVAAVGCAELARRSFAVQLGTASSAIWVVALGATAAIGSVVARRWCAGHAGVLETATCSLRVAISVLGLLMASLVPLDNPLGDTVGGRSTASSVLKPVDEFLTREAAGITPPRRQMSAGGRRSSSGAGAEAETTTAAAEASGPAHVTRGAVVRSARQPTAPVGPVRPTPQRPAPPAASDAPPVAPTAPPPTTPAKPDPAPPATPDPAPPVATDPAPPAAPPTELVSSSPVEVEPRYEASGLLPEGLVVATDQDAESGRPERGLGRGNADVRNQPADRPSKAAASKRVRERALEAVALLAPPDPPRRGAHEARRIHNAGPRHHGVARHD